MKLKKQADTSIVVQTPEGIEFSLKPAGILIRLCSYVIDVIIQGVISIAVIIIFAGAFAELFGAWMIFLYMFLLNWFYHVICELCFKGQSPGKKIIGIRVVRSNGSPINPGASFVRNLLRFADTFMGLFIIALSCMMVSPGFRRIGDLAADTLVVYTINSLSPTRNISMTWLSKYEKIIPPRTLSHNEKQMIILFAKRYPLLGEARANEIAKKYAADLCNQNNYFDQDVQSAANNFSSSSYLLGIAHSLSGDEK
jgi:uncharacterized RDD family membrane protein YckC